MAMNPGISAAGQAASAAAAGMPGRAAIGGMSAPRFDVDTTGLDQTSKKIQQIVSDISKLDAAVNKLASSLDKMGSKATSAFGGGQQGGGRGGLTTAPVSGGRFANAAAAVGFGEAGEVMAKAAGGINNIMANVQSGGGGADLIARQSAAIFSRNATGNLTAANVGAYNQILNKNPKDLNDALAQLQANPMLMGALQGGSQKNKQVTNFLTTLQQLNPTMGAAGAANVASSLLSGPALQALQRFGGRNGQMGQGLVNPQTMQINNPNRVFSEIVQTMFGGQHLNAAQMKAYSGTSAQATKAWNMITQNNNVPGKGLGLSNQMLTEVHQYMAAGGNIGEATKAMSRSPLMHQLQQSTAKTQLTDTTYQRTIDEQNAAASAATRFTNMMNGIVGHGGPLASFAAGFAGVTKIMLNVGEKLAGLEVLSKGAKGLSGGGGGGGGGVSALETGGAAGVFSRLFSGAGVAGKVGKVSDLMTPLAIAASGPGTVKAYEKNASGPLGLGAKGGSNMANLQHSIASHLGWNSNEGIVKNLFGWMGDPTGSTTTQGMTPRMARSISAMKAANPNIRISSGHRSTQQQATLYAMKGGRGVARPGQSNHQTGRAADLGPPSQFGWIAKNAAKFGLGRPAPASEPWHVESMGDPATGASVVSAAQGFLGTPYSWGGGNASGATLGIDQGAHTVGLDCSGLVVAVYAKLNISLPRTSQQQAKAGTAVSSLAQAQPGDLILYNEPGEGPNSHVAIYIGGGKQIAAPHTGTVVQVQSVDKAHLSCIRRIVGGGAGHSVVQAAQSMVGSPSNDAANHAASGINVGLANTFIQQVNAGGVGGVAGSPYAGGNASTGAVAATSGSTPSTGMSAGAASGGRMSAAQVFALASSVGLSKRAAQIATAVADVESRFNPTAIDHDSNGSTDYGLWQINSIHGVGTNMFSPSAAAQKMAQLTNKGTNWGPWAPDFGSSSYGGNPQVGGKVEAAMKSLGYMGDPGVAMGTSMGGMAPVSGGGMGGGGHRPINVYLTNQMISMSQSDAQQLVQMVIAAIKEEGGLASVSGS